MTVMRPMDPVTLAEAAKILGCSGAGVRRRVLAGQLPMVPRYRHRALPRQDVEHLALREYHWRVNLDYERSYWLTGSRAGGLLGVSRSRLGQLSDAGQVPFERHVDGSRLYRREQLEVVAQARRLRWLRQGSSDLTNLCGSDTGSEVVVEINDNDLHTDIP